MTISTQRLIIMLFMMSVVIGMVQSYWYENQYEETYLEGKYADIGQTEQLFKNDSTKENKITEGFTEDLTIGSGIGLGSILWDFFKAAIWPWNIQHTTYEEGSMERIVALGLNIFRSMLYFLIIMEVLLLFKNKKWT